MRLKRAKDKQGEICFLIIDGDKELLVPVEDYKEAVMAGISNGTIKKQIVKGKRHFRKYIRDYEFQKGLARLKREDREREERKQALAEEKQRKEQERLQMIEDAKCSSKWFQELSKNNLVAKLKKDKYGNQQLV
ncbi:hypothetical protein [Staphylococcus cohnii]|uniref:hypothetical protein n=1 Tax=Staphylococcus cohnii TaxID=29382 RepID=UPI000694066E|nr:hypothetical protein [Staphylococcus cohnii]